MKILRLIELITRMGHSSEGEVADWVLDLLSEEELEWYGDLLFDELLELVKVEEQREQENLKQIYS